MSKSKVVWASMVSKKSKFFVNSDKYLRQSRNIHFEALQTLKLLSFPELRQWTLLDLCTCIGNPHSFVHNHPPPPPKKNNFLEYSLKIQRKQLCPNLFFNNVEKETPTQVFSCEFCEIIRTPLFTEHLRWPLQSKHLWTASFVSKILEIQVFIRIW